MGGGQLLTCAADTVYTPTQCWVVNLLRILEINSPQFTVVCCVPVLECHALDPWVKQKSAALWGGQLLTLPCAADTVQFTVNIPFPSRCIDSGIL
jgi:hypothetical protein